MRRLLALTLAAMVLVPGAAAGLRGGPPGFPQLPGLWSHAEINVTIKNVPHTLILDRGRITKVAVDSITLRRFDGTVTQVPYADTTIIKFKNTPVTSLALRRGLYAETMRIDGGAAVRIRLTLRP